MAVNAEAVEFLKVFSRRECSSSMLIPRGFVEKIVPEDKEEVCVVLIGPAGERHPVVVAKERGCWFFEEGWKKFCRSNPIAEKDSLVFRYTGNMKFHVTVFAPDGKKKSTGDVADASDDNVEVTREVEGSSRKRRRGNYHDDNVEIIREAAQSPMKRRRGNLRELTPDEQRVADSFKSSHPFFVCTFSWNVGKFPALYLPVWFLKKHGLTLTKNQEINFINRSNDGWPVKINSSGGSFSAGKGFPRFLFSNKIIPGIKTILVVEAMDSDLKAMRVHFYH